MSDHDDDDKEVAHGALTIVDRNVVVLLENADTTPSALSPSIERLHRLHGTSLILSSTTLLKLNASTYATASAIFHRFYHQASLQKYDVWSVAMAATVLASKVEEEPRPIRQVVIVFAHLYRRRRLLCCQDPSLIVAKHDSVACSPKATSLTLAEKQALLRHVTPMSSLGPIYKEWHKVLTDMENVLLRQLGFTLYWIPDSHPHKFILYFVRVLEIDNAQFAQNAWHYCNDSCRMDLCVRFEPEIIACAAIYMAARDLQISLPDGPWWQVFVGRNCSLALSTICNVLLGLAKQDDIVVASTAFLPSLVKDGGAFNDPDGYLWDQSD